VDDSCRRVLGHVLPRERPDRGEGEDSVKNPGVFRARWFKSQVAIGRS